MAPNADDKFVNFFLLGLQWSPKSSDAMKICSQHSQSHYSEAQKVPKWYANDVYCRELDQHEARKLVKNAEHSGLFVPELHDFGLARFMTFARGGS